MADQFCLRWNNFQTNIVSALDSLKCSEDLVDVTLTCEGRNIKAHKVILSACSPYFRNVFKENPCQHPVIILKDVLAEDIVSLLSYMYQGEVFIEESKLSSFLHTAALLQVKGLTGVTQQTRESINNPITTNKLYAQLTISSKAQFASNKETKSSPAPKKRRSSTSDKPNDVSVDSCKKNKIVDSCDVKYDSPTAKIDSLPRSDTNLEIKIDGKNELTINNNNKGSSASYQTSTAPADGTQLTVKAELNNDQDSLAQTESGVAEDDSDILPDYEHSMLARSLLSGINPSKSDGNTNSLSPKNKVPNSGRKDINANSKNKSPPKVIPAVEDPYIKSEKHSPKSDMEYEPEVLLSEHNDGTDSDGTYGQEQSPLLLLAGMSNVPIAGGSTSQGTLHQQSNHAAICGNCPHCGMKYSNQSALKYHVRFMHSDLTNRLCCYLCPRSFTMRETFKEHMWTSHGQRN